MQKNLANPMARFREVFVLIAISRWGAGLGIGDRPYWAYLAKFR